MKKQYLFAAISILLWSSTATVTKLLLKDMGSFEVLCASSGFAFAFLLIVNLIKGNLKLLKQYSLKDYAIMFGMGFLGIFLYHALWYIGIDSMMASQAMIVNYLWPLMVVLSACVVLKEKLTLRKILAVIISFAGVIVVSTGAEQGSAPADVVKGTVLCVLAAMSYGFFVSLNKFLSYDSLWSMMVYYLAATLLSGAYVVFAGGSLAMDGIGTLGMVWIGVFTCAIAFVTWALAMKNGNTAKIANLAYITPFLSLVWSFFVLGEPIGLSSVLGLGLIVGGIFVQMKK